MMKEYSLRIYDEDLIRFSLSEQGIEGLQANITYVNKEKSYLFPLDLELTNESIIKWMRRRVIPKNRAFVHETLKTLDYPSMIQRDYRCMQRIIFK